MGGREKIGEGEGTLLKTLPFPKPHPLLPKTFVFIESLLTVFPG